MIFKKNNGYSTGEKKQSKFNPFNSYGKDGKGIEIEEKLIENPNLKNFFNLFIRKLREICTLNLYYLFGNFPFLFALFAISGYVSMTSSAPYHQVFAPLRGVLKFENSAVSAALGNIFGVEAQITVNTTATYVFYGLTALLIFTFGLVNVGVTFNMRNLICSEPVFMWSDFWYAIKRNLRQGIIFGIIDLALTLLLAWDVFYCYHNLGPTMVNVMFYFTLFGAVIYFFMRFYIYLMMVTYDLSLRKLIKNGLIFALLGFKRNIMATLGIVVILAMTYVLMSVYMPIGIIVPFVFLFGAGTFMTTYAAYPKIKMIDSGEGASDETSDTNSVPEELM